MSAMQHTVGVRRRTFGAVGLGISAWPMVGIRAALVDVVRAIWPAYVLAGVLLLVGITWSLPDHHYVDQSFQIDETVLVGVVGDLTFPRFSPTWLSWGTGLFYQVYVVKSLFSLGGLNPLDATTVLLLGRAVVVASAMATITLAYLLGRRLVDRTTGRLAAVILAVLPGFVVNSHYLKTDIPMTLWAVAAMLAAVYVVDRRLPAHVALLGALIGYSASVKYSAAVLLPAGIVALILGFRAARQPIPWKTYLIACFAGFFFGAPYAVLKPRELLDGLRFVASINSVGPAYVPGRPPALLDYIFNVMPYALTTPLLIAVGVSVVLIAATGGRRWLPIWTFALAYAVLLATDNMRLVRYTVPLLPVAAVIVAAGLRRVGGWPRLRVPTLAVGAALVTYAFVFSLAYVRGMAEPDPRAQADAWIEQNVTREAPIPTSYGHWLSIPRLNLIDRQGLDVKYDINQLAAAESPYLILSDMPIRFYREALDAHPRQREFLAYVDSHYELVADFQNSQSLFGVDAHSGPHLAQDWVLPNPRITIYRRLDGITAATAGTE
jgi:4-amino-4-deoxy-L-arabinose transferase-like glycosyltransferase